VGERGPVFVRCEAVAPTVACKRWLGCVSPFDNNEFLPRCRELIRNDANYRFMFGIGKITVETTTEQIPGAAWTQYNTAGLNASCIEGPT